MVCVDHLPGPSSDAGLSSRWPEEKPCHLQCICALSDNAEGQKRGLGGGWESVTTRKGLVAAVDGVAKEATAATKEATVCVGAANNAAVAAKDVISALYSKNNTLKC